MFQNERKLFETGPVKKLSDKSSSSTLDLDSRDWSKSSDMLFKDEEADVT